jgi:sporulation protein YlmC with PRC-barrel domain
MMRTSLLAAAASLALLAAPAFAQTNTQGGASPGTRGLGGSPSATQTRLKPDPLQQADISEIKGATVYGSDGSKIGDVSTVLMRPETHTIDQFVVAAGGVLGVGAHDVALPLDAFHWDAKKGGFVINHTEAQLKSMPSWNESGGAMSGSSTPPTGTSH